MKTLILIVLFLSSLSAFAQEKTGRLNQRLFIDHKDKKECERILLSNLDLAQALKAQTNILKDARIIGLMQKLASVTNKKVQLVTGVSPKKSFSLVLNISEDEASIFTVDRLPKIVELYGNPSHLILESNKTIKEKVIKELEAKILIETERKRLADEDFKQALKTLEIFSSNLNPSSYLNCI